MRSNIWHRWIPARSWFLFNTWFSVLVIVVSAAVTLHMPISKAAWPILIISCGLVIILAVRSRCAGSTGAFRWQSILSSLLVMGAVVVELRGSLVKGEFVSIDPDAWAYTAFAAFVQNPTPAIGAGLQPVLSFGRNLMGTRFGTAGLLALFAEIFGTDPCQAANICFFLVLAQAGLGFTLLARIFGAGRILSLCAGLFAVSIGWAPEVFKVGNWDQVLFLSFLPFVLLRIRFLTFQTSRRAGMLSLGLCLGAAAFAYPEGVAMSGVIYVPLVIWRLVRGDDPRRKIRKIALAIGVALLVVSVYLPTFVSFLLSQISEGGKLGPGKGIFEGLLSARWLSAVYSLGGQLPLAPFNPWELIVPSVFVGLSLVAMATWGKKGDGILLTLPTFLLLSLWQAGLLRYDYGLYKLVTMYWPVMVVAIFVGTTRLLARCRGLTRLALAAAFCALMAGAFLVERAHFKYSPWREERRVKPFLELTSLKRISGGSTICLVTQSWFNQMWAVFFLQGYKLMVPHPLGYLQHASSGLHDLTTVQTKGTFLLGDEKRPGAIWHNEIFSLMDHFDPMELLAIDAPNGVETVQGDSFVWLDNQFADLTIYSDASRRALLVIECWPGPSRPGDTHRTLIVKVNGARAEWTSSTNLKVPLQLNQGNNLVRLSCKEAPTVAKLSTGEARTLLLGIKGLRLTTREDPVELLSIDAPNRVETVQGDSFIWLNNQFTDLTVDSDGERQAFLKVRECWPGPSRPGDTQRTLIIEINGAKAEVPASPNLKVPLQLNQGKNLVRLSCRETATVDKLSSGDTRTLLLGIKGFSVTAAN